MLGTIQATIPPIEQRTPLYSTYKPPAPELTMELVDYWPSSEEAQILCARAIHEPAALEFLLDVISAQMRERFAAWQVAMIRAAISPDPALEEYLDSRNRGGSKTRDNAIASIIVPAGEPGTVGMWLSGNTHQLKQALRYVKRVLEWTFLGQVFDITTDRETKGRLLSFANGSELLYNASTATSGPRVNYLLYDEEGKITERDKIENNMNSLGMTSGARGRKRIRHFTTLAINTPAEEIYYQLEPLGLVFKHYPWDCVWWTPQDWRLLQKFVDRMPQWWINQEYLNELDAPSSEKKTSK